MCTFLFLCLSLQALRLTLLQRLGVPLPLRPARPRFLRQALVILHYVISFLTAEEQLRLGATCTELHAVSEDPVLWYPRVVLLSQSQGNCPVVSSIQPSLSLSLLSFFLPSLCFFCPGSLSPLFFALLCCIVLSASCGVESITRLEEETVCPCLGAPLFFRVLPLFSLFVCLLVFGVSTSCAVESIASCIVLHFFSARDGGHVAHASVRGINPRSDCLRSSPPPLFRLSFFIFLCFSSSPFLSRLSFSRYFRCIVMSTSCVVELNARFEEEPVYPWLSDPLPLPDPLQSFVPFLPIFLFLSSHGIGKAFLSLSSNLFLLLPLRHLVLSSSLAHGPSLFL